MHEKLVGNTATVWLTILSLSSLLTSAAKLPLVGLPFPSTTSNRLQDIPHFITADKEKHVGIESRPMAHLCSGSILYAHFVYYGKTAVSLMHNATHAFYKALSIECITALHPQGVFLSFNYEISTFVVKTDLPVMRCRCPKRRAQRESFASPAPVACLDSPPACQAFREARGDLLKSQS